MSNKFILSSNESVCGYGCQEQEILDISVSNEYVIFKIEERVDANCRYHHLPFVKEFYKISLSKKHEFIDYLTKIINSTK